MAARRRRVGFGTRMRGDELVGAAARCGDSRSMKSRTARRGGPARLASSTSASSASRFGMPSPAGEAVQSCRRACRGSGSARRRPRAPPASARRTAAAGRRATMSVQVVSAPMRQPLAVLGDAAQARHGARCRARRRDACRPSRRAPPWPGRRRCRRRAPSRAAGLGALIGERICPSVVGASDRRAISSLRRRRPSRCASAAASSRRIDRAVRVSATPNSARACSPV